MKTIVPIILLCVAGSLPGFSQQKQVLFLTTGTPTSGDVAVQNRLVQLGF